MKKNLFIIIVALVILAIGGSVVLWGSRTGRKVAIQGTPRVIEETLVIPDTQEVSTADARMLEQGAVAVPLVPKSEEEKVVVARAELTLKGGYAAAALVANQWDSAPALVFVKSLGAITLDGKSSSWQVIFSSPSKKNAGYEVILQGKDIVSKKEVVSAAPGAVVPQNWKDLGEVIAELQQHPLYQDASVTAASFHLNPDNKKWYYNILTSKGANAIAVE